MAPLDERIKGSEQPLDVVKVQARGGLVKNEERGGGLFLPYEVGQFYALVLAPR